MSEDLPRKYPSNININSPPEYPKMPKKIHVIGGGTVFHVRPHLSICAQARGTTAKVISNMARSKWPWPEYFVYQHLTAMAEYNSKLETNKDISILVDDMIADETTKVIFMTAALCDWNGSVWRDWQKEPTESPSGKGQPRLRTQDGDAFLKLTPADKVINKIRKQRKDIFLVACKTTAGSSEDGMFHAGLSLLKQNSCNLVLVNDVHTRMNMIVVPELSRYCVTNDRQRVLSELVDMSFARSGLTFSPTKVEAGELVKWDSERVPESLRKVVDHCIAAGAYNPFNDVTVGHFGYRFDENKFLSSRRKRNFNKPEDKDLVETTVVNGEVVAYGAKPSAGARSQYMALNTYPEYDCIVHFHSCIRKESEIPTRSQKFLECGSYECGKNTVDGMKNFGNVAAVMLDQHGPNIVFNSKIDPQIIINFIDQNFDLTKTTR